MAQALTPNPNPSNGVISIVAPDNATNSVVFENNGSISVAAGASLANSGTINNNLGASLANSGTFSNIGSLVNSGALTNSGSISGVGSLDNTGSVAIAAGTASFSKVTQLSSGILAGGNWNVSGGSLTLGDNTTGLADSITTLGSGTVVTLGAGGTFNQINGLASNSGALNLNGGRSFTVSNPFTNEASGVINTDFASSLSSAGALANNGTINNAGVLNSSGTVTGGGTLNNTGNVAITAGTASFGKVTQLNSGTLAGGNWNVSGGSLTLGDKTTGVADNITTLGSGTTVSITGSGDFSQLQSNLATNNGVLNLGGNRTLTQAFSNQGTVDVLNGATSITQASNFSGNTLNGGAWIASGGALSLGNGTDNITSITSGTTVNVGAGGSFAQLESVLADNTKTLTNAGSLTIGKAVALAGTLNSSGTLAVAGPLTNTGALNVTGGSATLANTTNLAAGTLTGGTWSVTGGSLNLNSGAALTSIATGTNVTVAGSGSFNQLNGLTSNDGALTIGAGKTYSVAGALSNTGTLTVDGVVNVQNTGAFSSSGAVNGVGVLNNFGSVAVTGGATAIARSSNLQGATLSGGNWTVSGGTLTIGDLNGGVQTPITALAGGTAVTLSGTGSFNQMDSLASNSGTFTIAGPQTFTFAGPFTNRGVVEAAAGSTLNSSSSVLNTVGSTIAGTGGTLNLNGSLNNQGKVSISAGAANIANLTNGASGTVEVSGGAATVNGTTNLSAGQLTGGNWVVSGGTLSLGSPVSALAGIGAGTTVNVSGSGSLVQLDNALNSGSLTNAGSLTFGPGKTVQVGSGATLSNSGVLIANGSSFTNNGTFNNQAGTSVLNNTTNLNAGALTGGTWNVTGGSLSINSGAAITSLGSGTVVTLGPFGSFNQINGLSSNSGTLNLSSGKSLALANPLNNASGGVINTSAGAQLSNSGALTNSGTINNAGSFSTTGSVTGSGRLDNTGSVTVAAGNASFGKVTQFVGNTLTGGTWNVSGGSLAVGESTSGAFNNITRIGSGATVSITGNGTFSQIEAGSGINQGTLTLGGTRNFVSFDNRGTLNVVSGSTTLGLTQNLVGGIILFGGNWNVSGGELTIDGGVPITQIGPGTHVALTGSGVFTQLENYLASVDTTTSSLTLGGSRSLAAELNNYGTVRITDGTATINTASSTLNGGTLQKGTWNVDGGALTLKSGGLGGSTPSITALGTGVNVSISNGATFAQLNSLTSNAGSLSVGSGSTVNLSSGFVNQATGALSTTSFGFGSPGTLVANGTVTNNGSINNQGRFIVASGATVNGSGSLSNAGQVEVGPGANASFAVANDLNAGTLSGGVWSVNGGALTLSGGAAIQQIAGGTTVQLSNGGTLNSIDSTLQGNAGTLSLSGGTRTFTNAFSNTGSVNVAGGAAVAFSNASNLTGGVLAGGQWTVTDTSTLNLNGGQAITSIASGTTVNVSTASSLNSLGNTLTSNAGSLTVGSGNFTQPFTNTGSVNATGNVSFANTTNLSGTTLSGGSWSVTGGSLNLNSNAVIRSISSGTSVSVASSGQLNNLASTLESNAGNLVLRGDRTLGTSASTSLANSGQLTVDGATQFTKGINNTGSVVNYGVMTTQGTSSNSGNITNLDRLVNTGDFTIQGGGSVGGSGGTYEQASGKTTLAGNLNQDLVVSGGTFGGTGSVRGNVTVDSGGTLAAGNLTINGNLNSTGTLRFAITGESAEQNDFLTIFGSADLGSSLFSFDFSGNTAEKAGSSYRLLYAKNGIDTGGLTGFAPSFYALGAGLTGDLSLDAASNSIFLTLRELPPSAVPLPAAAWLLMSGLGAFGVFGRRRKAVAV